MDRFGAGPPLALFGIFLILASIALFLHQILFANPLRLIAIILGAGGLGGILLLLGLFLDRAGVGAGRTKPGTGLRCRLCGEFNDRASTFCVRCGQPTGGGGDIRPICPSCGQDNDPDARFCNACGLGLKAGRKNE